MCFDTKVTIQWCGCKTEVLLLLVTNINSGKEYLDVVKL